MAGIEGIRTGQRGVAPVSAPTAPLNAESTRALVETIKGAVALSPAEKEALNALSAEQRAQYQIVAARLAGSDRDAFAKLLTDGKLTGARDLKLRGDLLANLATLATEQLGPGIDRRALLSDAVQAIADPGTITQGSANTCGAATVQIMLAKENAAEYIRILAGLASVEGKAELIGGQTVSRPRTWGAADIPGEADKLMQTALLAHAAGDYDFASDTRADGEKGGIYASEEAYLQEGVLGRAVKTLKGDDPHLLDCIAAQANAGKPVSVLIVTEGKGHYVDVTSIKDGKLTYIDPRDGQERTVDAAGFSKEIQAANLEADAGTALRKARPTDKSGALGGCGGVVGAIVDAVKSVAETVVNVVKKVVNVVIDAAKKAAEAVKNIAVAAFNTVVSVAKATFTVFKTIAQTTLTLAQTALRVGYYLATLDFGSAVSAAKNGLKDAWNEVKEGAKEAWNHTKEALKNVGKIITEAIKLAEAVVPGFKMVTDFLKSEIGQKLMMALGILALIPPLTAVLGPIMLAYALYNGVSMMGAGLESGDLKTAIMGGLSAAAAYIGLSGATGGAAGAANRALATKVQMGIGAVKTADALAAGDTKGAIMAAGGVIAAGSGNAAAQSFVDKATKVVTVADAIEKKDWTSVAAIAAAVGVAAATDVDEAGKPKGWLAEKFSAAKEWVGEQWEGFKQTGVGKALVGGTNWVRDQLNTADNSLFGTKRTELELDSRFQIKQDVTGALVLSPKDGVALTPELQKKLALSQGVLDENKGFFEVADPAKGASEPRILFKRDLPRREVGDFADDLEGKTAFETKTFREKDGFVPKVKAKLDEWDDKLFPAKESFTQGRDAAEGQSGGIVNTLKGVGRKLDATFFGTKPQMSLELRPDADPAAVRALERSGAKLVTDPRTGITTVTGADASKVLASYPSAVQARVTEGQGGLLTPIGKAIGSVTEPVKDFFVGDTDVSLKSDPFERVKDPVSGQTIVKIKAGADPAALAALRGEGKVTVSLDPATGEARAALKPGVSAADLAKSDLVSVKEEKGVFRAIGEKTGLVRSGASGAVDSVDGGAGGVNKGIKNTLVGTGKATVTSENPLFLRDPDTGALIPRGDLQDPAVKAYIDRMSPDAREDLAARVETPVKTTDRGVFGSVKNFLVGDDTPQFELSVKDGKLTVASRPDEGLWGKTKDLVGAGTKPTLIAIDPPPQPVVPTPVVPGQPVQPGQPTQTAQPGQPAAPVEKGPLTKTKEFFVGSDAVVKSTVEDPFYTYTQDPETGRMVPHLKPDLDPKVVAYLEQHPDVADKFPARSFEKKDGGVLGPVKDFFVGDGSPEYDVKVDKAGNLVVKEKTDGGIWGRAKETFSNIGTRIGLVSDEVELGRKAAQPTIDRVSHAVDVAQTAVKTVRAVQSGDAEGALTGAGYLMNEAGYTEMGAGLTSLGDKVKHGKKLKKAIDEGDAVSGLEATAGLTGTENLGFVAEKTRKADNLLKIAQSDRASASAMLQGLDELAFTDKEREERARRGERGNIQDLAYKARGAEVMKQGIDEGDVGTSLYGVGALVDSQAATKGGKAATYGKYAGKKADQGRYGEAIAAVGEGIEDEDIASGGRHIAAGQNASDAVARKDYGTALGEAGYALENKDLTRAGDAYTGLEAADRAQQAGDTGKAIRLAGGAIGSGQVYEAGRRVERGQDASQAYNEGRYGESVYMAGNAMDDKELMGTGNQITRGEGVNQAIQNKDQDLAQRRAADMLEAGGNESAAGNVRADRKARLGRRNTADTVGTAVEQAGQGQNLGQNLETLGLYAGIEAQPKVEVSASAKREIAKIESLGGAADALSRGIKGKDQAVNQAAQEAPKVVSAPQQVAKVGGNLLNRLKGSKIYEAMANVGNAFSKDLDEQAAEEDRLAREKRERQQRERAEDLLAGKRKKMDFNG